MKKFLYYLAFILCTSFSMNGQELTDSLSLPKTVNSDSLLVDISENVARLAYQSYAIEPERGRYKMYPTENIYNLLKLDTATGRI